MRHAHWITVFVAAALMLGAADAYATTVWLNGNVVASDTFEGDTVGSPPVADVGTWSNDGNFYFGRPLGVVTDAASPGAFSGSQYLNLVENGANGSLAAAMSLAIGDRVQFESMVYATGAGDYPWQFVILAGANSDASNRLLDFYRYSGGGWEATSAGAFAGPASFALDTWQKWELDYTVGAANATLTINGVSASVPATNTTLNASNGLLVLFQNQPATPTYLDAVPEPQSWIMVVLGVGTLAVAARYKSC